MTEQSETGPAPSPASGPRVSIVTHFYNNPYCLDRMLRSFEGLAQAHPGAIEFIIVDDHSDPAPDPAIYDGIPDLRVFRLLDDVAWNMPGARNIGVHEAQSDMILLMDIDHIIDPQHNDRLLTLVDTFEPRTVATFGRIWRKPSGRTKRKPGHINSFLIRKSDYLSVGGFEELFSGHYGHEDKYFKVCCRRNGIKETELELDLLIEPGTFTKVLDRDRSHNDTILKDLLQGGVFKAQKTLSFPYERIR